MTHTHANQRSSSARNEMLYQLCEKNPAEAIVEYRRAYEAHAETFTAMDAKYALRSLQEALQADNAWALKLAEKYHDPIVGDAFAWYVHKVVVCGRNSNELIQSVDVIIATLKHSKQMTGTTTTAVRRPIALSLFRLCESYSDKPRLAAKMLETIWLLDPEKISGVPLEPAKRPRTGHEVVSDYERYMIFFTKALFKNERYEECITKSNEALRNPLSNHLESPLGFKIRKALSFLELGERDAFEVMLQNVVAK